ncbi:1-acyl-sn-glycerol-3-phosphate acyltransferase [Acidithiobacillus caldus]|uniref:1-acyl-sn-glycerol-3-phosphate acyltransferase n=1 Tax=Acidithiobacillus caldus TaxID=33059 RepID=UPI0007D8D2B9|nr:1-acyl-sn-glycerol-3-phosphate acyltransferase [Acidithiobacillus caldus]QER44800.1 hypothetical protein F0726_01736 [Acidithiobacillus caldus]
MLILVRPHTSLLDGPRGALRLRREGVRRAVFPVDSDYARHPFYGWLLKLYGLLLGGYEVRPLDTCKPFALRELSALLKAVRPVVIFPQGTGLSDPNRPDKPGVDWLIRRTGCAVRDIWLS